MFNSRNKKLPAIEDSLITSLRCELLPIRKKKKKEKKFVLFCVKYNQRIWLELSFCMWESLIYSGGAFILFIVRRCGLMWRVRVCALAGNYWASGNWRDAYFGSPGGWSESCPASNFPLKSVFGVSNPGSSVGKCQPTQTAAAAASCPQLKWAFTIQSHFRFCRDLLQILLLTLSANCGLYSTLYTTSHHLMFAHLHMEGGGNYPMKL